MIPSGRETFKIGDVFTPPKWAEFAVKEFGIYEKWLSGSSIFDPTMGEANLLEALVEIGLSDGKTIDQLPVNKLFGNEMNLMYFQNAQTKFLEKYQIDMSSNFTNDDFLTLKKEKFDVVFGNPPWQNFVNLPDSYKEHIKSYFHKYDLVESQRNLLLGCSRVDFAALIIQMAIKDCLNDNGEAIFFMPLSMLLNGDANKKFRTYSVDNVCFAIEKIFDFNLENVFEKVATRYCLTHFVRDKKAVFPIPYFIRENRSWSEFYAKPLFCETDPLSIFKQGLTDTLSAFKKIIVSKDSSPRQGINTCGANDVFFFDEMNVISNQKVAVSNNTFKDIILPKSFIFPLITATNFKNKNLHPAKWVLLPYDCDGKCIDFGQIEKEECLFNYLNMNRERLEKRKGVMLQSKIKNGKWWALFGVGAYNFFPYKIVWESYGRDTFNPMLFEGRWQVNQSLQSYIPVRTKQEAERILKELKNKKVEEYLLSLKMGKTMNWAQPGKIKKLLCIGE